MNRRRPWLDWVIPFALLGAVGILAGLFLALIIKDTLMAKAFWATSGMMILFAITYTILNVVMDRSQK